jgi:RND family efflux transporter MFP subunit
MRKVVKIFLPFIIILIGLSTMMTLISRRSEPKKEVKRDLGSLARIMTVTRQDHQVIVYGTGTVKAAQEVSIIPQVSGKLIYVAPSMVAGGFFQKDDLLFEMDDSDYRLALDQAKAAMAKAEYELATIDSQASVARAEWERLSKDDTSKPNPLVLYEPQLKNAQASLASAIAAVEQAELNLARTKILAPFNCRVRSEKVDLGQYIMAGNSVAVIAGTDSAEVLVPLPLKELRWLNIPRWGEQGRGSKATVRVDISGTHYDWKGRIIRSLGEVDTQSRMMQIVIAVLDPYGLKEISDARPSLTPGMFVEVLLQGRTLSNVFSVPRSALREQSTIWLMDDANQLRIQAVEVIRQERSLMLIGKGLEEGDRIVLTKLSGVVDGMKLRVISEDESE